MKQKLETLDALRVFACLLVVCFHAYLTLAGYVGLSIFFIMSGFLSVYNYYDSPNMDGAGLGYGLKLAARKMMKLYPVHAAMLLFPLAAQLYGAANGLISFWRVFAKLASQLLLIHSWIPVNEIYFSLNIPTWYLSTIFFSYAMVPLVVRALRKYRSTGTALLIIAGIYVLQLFSTPLALRAYTALCRPDAAALSAFGQWFSQVFPVFRFGDFAVGCNLAYIFMHRRERARSDAAYTAAEIAAVLFWLATEYVFEHQAGPDFVTTTCLFLPSAAVFVYLFALGRGRVSRALTGRFTHSFAALSTDIYLVHYVVIMAGSILCTRLPLSASAQKLAFVCFVCVGTAALAFASRRLRSCAEAKMKKIKHST